MRNKQNLNGRDWVKEYSGEHGIPVQAYTEYLADNVSANISYADHVAESLTDIDVFPNESYAKVVWAGLNDPESKITNLQKEIDSKIELLDFKKDTRFHPHLTLARVNFVEDKERFIKNLKEIKIKKETFQITEFKLIKSTLTGEGPVYEDLASFS
jgi:2'-5' RNA ligase